MRISDWSSDVCSSDLGWFLGDSTGAGKGRQVAGIILDNWLKGRRRAVWISVSDRLLEDAQRDWSALGQERLLVTPLSRFRQGTDIRLGEGVLFTTYATLRSRERGGKKRSEEHTSELQSLMRISYAVFCLKKKKKKKIQHKTCK